jgi:PTS system cellobiose-specific IIB component
MQNAAKLQEADVKIWACSEAEAKSHYDDVDVIMLGPQVRFLLSKVEAAVKNKNVRVAVVDIMNYGRMDGEAVLKQAMSL